MSNISNKLIKSSIQPQNTMLQLATYTDSKGFNNGLARLEQTLSIRQSIEVAPLISGQGEKKNVVKEIIRIIEFFLTITGKELDEFQIIVLAGDLYEKFRTDTFEDIILMFKMARMGDFGKNYKFDTFTIMEWANLYLDRKSAEREKMIMARKEKKEEKKRDGKYFHELPQELQDKLNNTLKRWKTGAKNDFLPPKATESLAAEKHIREIQKEMNNDNITRTFN